MNASLSTSTAQEASTHSPAASDNAIAELPRAGGDGFCTPLYNALWGWRNVVQVMRFMWDLIDTNNEGGNDDVDYTAGSLVTAMQSMPTGWGVDGSCRESEQPPGQYCNPPADGPPVTGGTGSRDAYNPRDVSDLLPENLANVMSINCVSFATDN